MRKEAEVKKKPQVVGDTVSGFRIRKCFCDPSTCGCFGASGICSGVDMMKEEDRPYVVKCCNT